MKKKILAAFVCAVTVLSLAGCAGSKNDRSPENTPSAPAAPSTPNLDTSKPAVSSTDTTSSTPEANLADWDYRKYNYKGEDSLRIAGYKGTDQKIEIPAEINGLKVTQISSGAFRSNTDITSVTVPESVVEIDEGAFTNCSNLSEIIFKGSAPTLVDGLKNPLNIFDGTPWLEAKKAETPGLFIIGDVLYKGFECEGDIIIPDGVKKISDFAFYQNANITSVTIPDGATEIGEYAFNDCRALASAVIPDSVTTIGKSAFYLCPALKSANIPQNIVKIGANAFSACYGLEGTFTLPDSIKELGNNAFECNNIELVYKGTSYKGSSGYTELNAAIQQNAAG